MKNPEKWYKLTSSDKKLIKKTNFKSEPFIENGIEKYVSKKSNLTYYYTIEGKSEYIRCFNDYKEIDFITFVSLQDNITSPVEKVVDMNNEDIDESSANK